MASIAEINPPDFWKYVEKPIDLDRCWRWKGRLDAEGHPKFAGERAERVAWQLSRPLVTLDPNRALVPRCQTGYGCVHPEHWILSERPAAAPQKPAPLARLPLPANKRAPEPEPSEQLDPDVERWIAPWPEEAAPVPPKGQGIDVIMLTSEIMGVVSSYLAQNPGRIDVVRSVLEDVARTVGRV